MGQNGRESKATVGVSVARLLDQLRQLLVEAWDQKRRPDHALVHPSLYRAVLQAKRREASSGRPVSLLGLELRGSDQVPVDRPEVH